MKKCTGINSTEFKYVYKVGKIGLGHKGFNCIDNILFLKLIMRYIEVYYSIFYIIHYHEIFSYKNKRQKRVVFILWGYSWLVSFNFFPSNSVSPTFKD